MESQTLPVLAYVGPDAEVLFLQSLLQDAGVVASIDMPIRGENGVRHARLFVEESDVEAAAPVVLDFRLHGMKSSG